MNGLAYSGAWIPYGSTFLIFSDYMRPAIRLAALSKLQSIFVFTHDSVFLGEDGPTHQPVEHLTALRAIPNVWVIRPADGAETSVARATALRRKEGPTCLAPTRQKVPAIRRPGPPDPTQIARGGYIVADTEAAELKLVLIGTGSELHLCLEAKEILAREGVQARVVSMPCIEAFLAQPGSYRNKVLPSGAKYVVVEAGLPWAWYRIVPNDSLVLGVEDFGVSAPDKVIAEKLGFTGPQVAAKILAWLKW